MNFYFGMDSVLFSCSTFSHLPGAVSIRHIYFHLPAHPKFYSNILYISTLCCIYVLSNTLVSHFALFALGLLSTIGLLCLVCLPVCFSCCCFFKPSEYVFSHQSASSVFGSYYKLLHATQSEILNYDLIEKLHVCLKSM